MEITPGIRDMLNETKETLSGYKCRHFMAQVVETMLDGSPMRAEKELGWNRVTLGKALAELQGGFCFIDHYHQRGRKRSEDHLPRLLDDIREVAERHSQTDPTFRTTGQYTRLTAVALRQQLIDEKGYTDEELPTEQTIRTKLNDLGYSLKRVKKAVH
ncbi:MAG: hypothetical protein KDD92_19960 [Caldilineaceae bacterium]|nr:hypothetical protein [Caldilineaceae bacterium]